MRKLKVFSPNRVMVKQYGQRGELVLGGDQQVSLVNELMVKQLGQRGELVQQAVDIGQQVKER